MNDVLQSYLDVVLRVMIVQRCFPMLMVIPMRLKVEIQLIAVLGTSCKVALFLFDVLLVFLALIYHQSN